MVPIDIQCLFSFIVFLSCCFPFIHWCFSQSTHHSDGHRDDVILPPQQVGAHSWHSSWMVGGWAYPSEKPLLIGISIPNIWKNKKCSKPPTSYGTADERNPGPPKGWLKHVETMLKPYEWWDTDGESTVFNWWIGFRNHPLYLHDVRNVYRLVVEFGGTLYQPEKDAYGIYWTCVWDWGLMEMNKIKLDTHKQLDFATKIFYLKGCTGG